MKITYNELSFLLKILNYELSLTSKYSYYASSLSDMTLKSLFEQLAAQHKNHSETIITYIKDN